MQRLLAALTITGLSVSSALAGSVVVYDRNLGEEFAAKEEIVALAKEIYGETAVYATGDTLPMSVENQIAPGSTPPEGIGLGPVPGPLAGRLPHTEPGSEWLQLGDHLVEVRKDGVIAMTVYDVLP